MISVMIPVYNAEKTISQCLDSILAQTMQEFEVVVINDGSTDGTAAILDDYVARDARIRVLHQKNKGLANVRNRLVQESRGEHVTFLDSDDRLLPDYLSALYAAMQNSGAPCVSCNHYIVRESNRELRFDERESLILSSEQAMENILYHGIPDVSAWGKLYTRELLERIQYPDGALYEDTYVIADVLLAAGRITFIPEPLYEYILLDNSISRTCKDGHVWDFCKAVDHMLETVSTHLPNCEAGCIRRRAHAIMSTMRTLDPKKHRAEWKKAHADLCPHALLVLKDPRAPIRDKLGILAALPGQWFYRLIWGMYEKMR